MKTYQASRYELKYLITEPQANAIQSIVGAYLRPDPFTDAHSIGYHVRSLYFDSRNLRCYNQTLTGEKNRYKLRMRFYDEDETSPVFLEIKRRVTNVIQKKRATVSHAAANDIIRGANPTGDMLLKNTAAERDALEDFCRLRDEIGAVGKVYVDYFRRAYQSGGGNQFRVTFDRKISGSPYHPGNPLHLPARRKITQIEGVVLEMKFINQPAFWMNDLARRFQLSSTSVPKYVESVDVLQSSGTAMEMRGPY